MFKTIKNIRFYQVKKFFSSFTPIITYFPADCPTLKKSPKSIVTLKE